jgi:hypothetical protein
VVNHSARIVSEPRLVSLPNTEHLTPTGTEPIMFHEGVEQSFLSRHSSYWKFIGKL